MTPLPNRLPILGVLALLVAMMALAHPSSAEGDAASCATGGAVPDAANNPGLVSDCDALLEARDTLAGSGSLNWSTGASIGQWVGVTVIGSPLRVTKLTLGRKGLAGEIPEELGNLTNLQWLDLSGNELSGEIPPELGGLSNLQSLDLSFNGLSNGLSGEIPPELGSLTNLQSLDLSFNGLSGEIPPGLGSLSNLQSLHLAFNGLSGGIPPELGSLTNLQSLHLADNELSGGIPPELGSLTNLQWLHLTLNQLSGEIPAELGSLTNLQWLHLALNQLSGEIPAELGSLTNLQLLHLADNELSGGIPPELGSLSDLRGLRLGRNQLSGEIPEELGSLTNLKRLGLAGNQLSGEIPAQLGGLSNLQWLDLSGNELSGCIPAGLLGIRASNLNVLSLPFCASRFVKEGAEAGSNVGDPVVTTKDYVGDPFIEFGVLLPGSPTYTLGGADAELFDIDSSTSQITVGAGTQLDYETKDRYEVTVTATDTPSGASDTVITVTIMVTDVRTGEIPPCTPVPGSPIDPCEPDVALISGHGFEDIGSEPWSVRFYLDDSRGRILVPHLVVRGTYIPGTVRCIADNTARYPSYTNWPNRSVPKGISEFKCYADVRVNAYVVGSGPSTLTVLVWPFGYWSNATPEAIERLRSYYERFFIEGWDGYVITVPAGGIGGREAMLFLGPPIDVSIESWRVYTTWDVQLREDGTVVAVHPHRDVWRTLSPTEYQTYRSALEMELPAFTQAVTAAHQARLTKYGGRIGPEENLPMLVNDANQLRQYYNEVGAYSHPEGPPAQPPPVYVPAPASLTATASGETTELGEESADLSWSSVTGASGYHVQHRISGAGERWLTVDESVTGTTHTASGLWCGRTHEFRVGAHGDGTTYNARAGLWSPTATATTAACSPLPPRFRADSYSLDVSAAGISVSDGVVSAFDLNDDAVTYSITAGDEAGKFRIDSSTGKITTTGPPGSPVGTTYTLTVGAADGVSGTTTVTVTVTVVVITCSGGIVVPYPGIESGLVSDCEVLLGLRDTLVGSATLNWSVDSPIADWEGVNLAGSPLRVTRLALERLGLTGVVPPKLGELTGLKELLLGRNGLTGEIPPELGDLVNLGKLDLSDNQLSGEIPSELGSLANLRRLYLSLNELSGEIPPELGSLANLDVLALSRNQLSGEIPPELGSLTDLWRLYLSDNRLSGEIPMELGSLSNLQRLLLSDNQLSGCIPEGLRDVASNDLEDLDLPFCASRSIREDAAEGSNVGNPVVATDDGEGDTLTYTLGGADADSFDIDSSTGQITVGDGTQLDYETKDRYDVTVTATDPSSGASDTTTVAIMVTDVRVSEDAAVNAYDANTNETIEKSEVIDAILDYLNYEIEKGLVLDLIGLYFAPTPTPTATPTPSLAPTSTPTPTQTPTHTPTPEPACMPNSGQLTLEQEQRIADLPWAQDNPWSVRALQRLATGSPAAFQAWMQHFGDDETSWPLIEHYASIAFCDEAIALRVLQMPFLDQVPVHDISVGRDILILRELSRLARSSLDDLEAVLSHPELHGRITDASIALVLLLILDREDAAAAAAIQALPWVGDGIAYIDFDARPLADYVEDETNHVMALVRMAQRTNRSVWAFLEIPWVRDGISRIEWPIFNDLENMASGDDEGTTRILEMPFLETLNHDDRRITSLLLDIAYRGDLQQLLSSPKLEGGIRDDQFATLALVDVELQNPDAAAGLNDLAWLQDGIDPSEEDAVHSLVNAAVKSDSIFRALLTKTWVQDGLTPNEIEVVNHLSYMASSPVDGTTGRTDEATPLRILDMPFLEEITSLDAQALSSLEAFMFSAEEGVLQQVLSHPEMRGGITDDWTNLVAVTWLAAQRPGLLDVLLNPDQTSVEKLLITLPLAGKVTLSVIEPEVKAAAQPGSALLDPMDLLEHTVRTQEEFMGVAFPESHVVLFVADISPEGGGEFGHGVIASDSRSSAYIIAHETAHIWDVQPNWLAGRRTGWIIEGVAEFLTAISERARVGTPLPEPKDSCGLANSIADLVRVEEVDSKVIYGSACNYTLGRGMFLELYDGLGNTAFRQGFRNLYLMSAGKVPAWFRQDECAGRDAGLCYLEAAFFSDMTPEQTAIADEIITRRYYSRSP